MDSMLLLMQETITSLNVMGDIVRPLVLATVFTLMGVVLFVACIWIMVKLAPFCVVKEIEEDQNVALGLIMGAVILGVAIILAASIMPA